MTAVVRVTQEGEVGADPASAAPIVTCRDYWAGTDRPYRNILVDSNTGSRMDCLRVLDAALAAAGAQDGDEVVFEVRKTGRRPFGDRKVRLTAPHTYELEPVPSVPGNP